MADHLYLSTSEAWVVIDPRLGASILRYRLAGGRDIFRTAPEDCADPFATGCFLMAPWCNRISGGVTVDGTFVPIPRNREDQALPIHGSVASARFEVIKKRTAQAALSARITGPDPFDYTAHVTYTLEGSILTVVLAVTHEGDGTVPYGLGLHPWFPREGQVDMRARATHYYETDADLLPTGKREVADRSEWNFNQTRALPRGLIDAGFAGWDGQARIRGAAEWGLDVRTDPPCGWYQVYSPGKDAGFFCLEPVTHPIDAHNSPGQPGLVPLARGETTTLTTPFIPV